MRIFVYEYTCAVPAAAGAASLRAEGAAMRAAVRADFAQIADWQTVTLTESADEAREFRLLVRNADFTLLIAPETAGILAERCRWVLAEGGKLLGPTLSAIELCSDKLALAEHWRRAGVPTPATALWPGASAGAPTGQFVIKPRFGAGCASTFRGLPPQCEDENLIVQPWVTGMAASVAFLIGPSLPIALVPVQQRLIQEGAQLRYVGGALPLATELADRAERIGRQAITAVAGLAGYVGVDIVLGDDGLDWAIEINPRMTTSYVGLRQLCASNLMAALIDVAHGRQPDLLWKKGQVRFDAAGTCEVL